MGRYRGKQAEKSMKKHRYRVLPRFKFGVLGLPVPTLPFGGSVSGTLATVSKPWLDSAFPIYRIHGLRSGPKLDMVLTQL